MDPWKNLRIAVVGLFALMGVAVAGSSLARGQVGGLAALLFFALMALLADVMFRRATRIFRSVVARATEAMQAAARELFDEGAAEVTDRWDDAVARRVFGVRAKARDGFTHFERLAIEGHHGGGAWQIASLVIPTRNEPLYLAMSYVRVDVEGAEVVLRARHQTGFGRLARKLTGGRDVHLGDAAFDDEFLLEGDAALFREVFDESVRARLMELAAVANKISVLRGLELEVADGSLVLHWPDELTAGQMCAIRDVLAQLRARLIAALGRRAAAGVRVGGLRDADVVVSDEAALERAPSAVDDAKRAR